MKKTALDYHVEVFGVKPVVIGANWEDVHERIADAIERGEPYNEKEELTPEELKAFEDGNLIF